MADPVAPGVLWPWLSRLGEAQLLLPALLLAAIGLARQPGGRGLALTWLLATSTAGAITLATKVAFIGFAVGSAPLDFTGISGHAVFAAAVLPLLLRLGGGPLSQRQRLALGYALAAAVAASRVAVHAHTWSEVLVGFALGVVASGATLWAGRWPTLQWGRWAPVALLVGALVGVIGAPPSRTHDGVTRLSLAVSGRGQPYERWELHRDHRRQLATKALSAAPSLQWR